MSYRKETERILKKNPTFEELVKELDYKIYYIEVLDSLLSDKKKIINKLIKERSKVNEMKKELEHLIGHRYELK